MRPYVYVVPLVVLRLFSEPFVSIVKMIYIALAVVSVLVLGGYLIATRPNQEQDPTEWQATPSPILSTTLRKVFTRF